MNVGSFSSSSLISLLVPVPVVPCLFAPVLIILVFVIARDFDLFRVHNAQHSAPHGLTS